MNDTDVPLSIFEHINELKKRTLISIAAFVVCSALFATISPAVLKYLAAPLMNIMPRNSTFIVLTPFEAWSAYFRISLIGGLVLSSPVWLAQIFAFISPAIDRRTKKASIIYGMVAGILFIIGTYFCYAWVLPAGFSWAMDMTKQLGATMLPRLESYISFSTGIIAAFGLAFELPFVVAMLIGLGLVSAETFSYIRRYAIVVAFILGAVLAPPDVLSQVALAVPLFLLYEIGILIGRGIRARSVRRMEQKA